MTYPDYRDRSDLLWSEDDFEVDPETGCWLWQRNFQIWGRKGEERMHAVIKNSRHYNAARQIMVDYVGEELEPTMWVVGICDANVKSFIKRCVNPEHHELRVVRDR